MAVPSAAERKRIMDAALAAGKTAAAAAATRGKSLSQQLAASQAATKTTAQTLATAAKKTTTTTKPVTTTAPTTAAAQNNAANTSGAASDPAPAKPTVTTNVVTVSVGGVTYEVPQALTAIATQIVAQPIVAQFATLGTAPANDESVVHIATTPEALQAGQVTQFLSALTGSTATSISSIAPAVAGITGTPVRSSSSVASAIANALLRVLTGEPSGGNEGSADTSGDALAPPGSIGGWNEGSADTSGDALTPPGSSSGGNEGSPTTSPDTLAPAPVGGPDTTEVSPSIGDALSQMLTPKRLLVFGILGLLTGIWLIGN